MKEKASIEKTFLLSPVIMAKDDLKVFLDCMVETVVEESRRNHEVFDNEFIKVELLVKGVDNEDSFKPV